ATIGGYLTENWGWQTSWRRLRLVQHVAQSRRRRRHGDTCQISELTNYFRAHGVSDLSLAQHKAIVALGNVVRRQALIIGFSDTFVIIGSRWRSPPWPCCLPPRRQRRPTPGLLRVWTFAI